MGAEKDGVWDSSYVSTGVADQNVYDALIGTDQSEKLLRETDPHVHMIAYSTVPGEGYLAEKGVEKIRSVFAREIFQQDLLCTYQKQT